MCYHTPHSQCYTAACSSLMTACCEFPWGYKCSLQTTAFCSVVCEYVVWWVWGWGCVCTCKFVASVFVLLFQLCRLTVSLGWLPHWSERMTRSKTSTSSLGPSSTRQTGWSCRTVASLPESSVLRLAGTVYLFLVWGYLMHASNHTSTWMYRNVSCHSSSW